MTLHNKWITAATCGGALVIIATVTWNASLIAPAERAAQPQRFAPTSRRTWSDTRAFIGSWHWSKIDDSASFSLHLRLASSTGEVTGDYCAAEDYGNRSDCDPYATSTIHGNMSNGSMAVTITDSYGGGVGHGTLTLNTDGSLSWNLVDPPAGPFYIPLQAILTCIQR